MSLLQRYRDRAKENWPRIARALKQVAVVFLLVLVFLSIYFFNRIFVSIEAGHGGVLWRRFLRGTDLKHVYAEGFHIIPPWDRMTIYNLRIQQVPHEFIALSKDGLPIEVEVSIRFRPQGNKLPMLHQNVGPEYVEQIVKPEVQAMVRFVLAQYTPEEVYTSEGFLLNIIKQGALGQILERHILLDDLLIKRLSLPELVRTAIESKLVQQQLVLEYPYRLDREQKEAERKRIEATGIRDFQLEVMKGGAFDKYLRYQGVDATVRLASSPNAKVVVIGGGADGLPVILNMPDGPMVPGAEPVDRAAAATPSGAPHGAVAPTGTSTSHGAIVPARPPVLPGKVPPAGATVPQGATETSVGKK